MEQLMTSLGVQTKPDIFHLVEKLIQKFAPLEIYRFANPIQIVRSEPSYFKGDTQILNHHFLLMITGKSERIEHIVQDFANHHLKIGKITILVHGKVAVHEAINNNNRFFINIIKNNKLIYNQFGDFQRMPVKDFVPTSLSLMADMQYVRQLSTARGFLNSAKICWKTGYFYLSSFMAHQVVEQCCQALIKVFLGYRCGIHNLNRQLNICESFSSIPLTIFLSEDENDIRLFKILVTSYSAARYQENFIVYKEDAKDLITKASEFVKIADDLCQTKFNELQTQLIEYENLKADT